MSSDGIIKKYELLKKNFKNNENDSKITEYIFDIYNNCIEFLNGVSIKDLKSLSANKSYFTFEGASKFSRAVNKDLFCTNPTIVNSFFDCMGANSFSQMSSSDITKACYTIAISFCCSIDLLKSNDQKTPGTFFEYFIGHLYSKRFSLKPRTQLDVLNLDMQSTLPTDFVFDLGTGKPKYHVPVKTSTRERVIQVWGHQRVLDGVYGTGRFLGLLTCLSETKLDHKKLEVVEICLPEQWRLYQLFIAQLKRIYYLDIPRKYEELNNVFPKINIKPFGDFFSEADVLDVF